MKKDTFVALLAVGIIAGSIALFYNFERNRERRNLATHVAGFSPRGATPRTVEGLVDAIARYQARIDRHVRDAAQTGAYWKILGIRLADQGMHRLAVDAFEQAIEFNPDDPTLFFLLGESASRVAASTLEFPGGAPSERLEYFALAESAFLRAIELDATYGRPRFSLGVMYVFDLDRPEDAIVQLGLFLQISPRDVAGMFVLARAYVVTERFLPAIELYERILSMSGDSSVRAEAQANLNMVRELMLHG